MIKKFRNSQFKSVCILTLATIIFSIPIKSVQAKEPIAINLESLEDLERTNNLQEDKENQRDTLKKEIHKEKTKEIRTKDIINQEEIEKNNEEKPLEPITIVNKSELKRKIEELEQIIRQFEEKDFKSVEIDDAKNILNRAIVALQDENITKEDVLSITEECSAAYNNLLKLYNSINSLNKNNFNTQDDKSLTELGINKNREHLRDFEEKSTKTIDLKVEIPKDKVYVKNKNRLTKEEKQKIREAVLLANPNLNNHKIDISDKGKVTVSLDDKIAYLENTDYILEENNLTIKIEQEKQERLESEDILPINIIVSKLENKFKLYSIENETENRIEIQTEGLPEGLSLTQKNPNEYEITGRIQNINWKSDETERTYNIKVIAKSKLESIPKDIVITIKKDALMEISVPTGVNESGYKMSIIIMTCGFISAFAALAKLRKKGADI